MLDHTLLNVQCELHSREVWITVAEKRHIKHEMFGNDHINVQELYCICSINIKFINLLRNYASACNPLRNDDKKINSRFDNKNYSNNKNGEKKFI